MNDEDLKKALKDIDVVIHLASITDAPSTISKPQETERVNFEGTKKILDASINAGVKKLNCPPRAENFKKSAAKIRPVASSTKG